MTNATNPEERAATRMWGLVTRIEAVLAAIFLCAMVILIFTGGVARMARYPLNWTIDFATCFFAWATFLAADIAWRNSAFMSVTVLTSRLKPDLRKFLEWANYIIISIFLAYLIYAGTKLAIVSSARSFQGIPWISYSWVTMSLPAGAGLLMITTFIKFYQSIAGDARQGAAEVDVSRVEG
ncbi:TRAP transporter small permease [Nitratireductor basaltis]|uniref:TRAP transporter small permease protein n=1 Tax=Nitratireductor basaltis TaxID=472175 RepID=A0A084U8U4_9HYPH|nr:TRAP transporter small permease [Nitratireductor basaltis]KFB09380.1 TRAP transporter, DctM subunit [Nitratireductor basaltis]